VWAGLVRRALPWRATMGVPAGETSEPVLLREDRDGVARLMLNRPAARNALSIALLDALAAQLTELAEERAVRVVVIGGSGPAFCAGHDLKEMRADEDPARLRALFRQCSDVMLAIVRLAKPVIARVHGVATAAGCQLVATCDLAIAARSARFATPGVNIGLFCSTPMVALSRVVGRKRALEMLVTGELLSAEEAAQAGLVNRAVDDAQLDAAVDALAATIAAKSPRALAIGKRAFYRQLEQGLEDAYAYASEVMAENMRCADAAEGIDAFLARREPRWKGE
jgi:enoyl-CoA hydratase/carnithine racemase